MEENGLKSILRDSRKRPFRLKRRCPEDEHLAAYADGRLTGAEREAVEEHLADCDACLDQVSFLVRSSEWSASADVPAPLVARAKELVPGRPRLTPLGGWGWARAAAVAFIVLTVSLIIVLEWRQSVERGSPDTLVAQNQEQERESSEVQHGSIPPVSQPSESSRSERTPQIPTATRPQRVNKFPKQKAPQPPPPRERRGEVSGLSPLLLFPRDGLTIKREELEFRWQPVSDALFYELFVVTASGGIILEKRSEGTLLRVPVEVFLEPGEKYFVWVRAHLRDGKTAKSGVMSFWLVN